MSTVKVDKDVFIRDRYGVRIRAFVAGSEVDQDAYDKAVTPQDHPTSTGVQLVEKKDGAMETKTLPEVNAQAKREAAKTEVVGAPAEELEAQEEGEDKKAPAKADAKAKK